MEQYEEEDPPEMQLLLEDVACEEEEACRSTPPGHTSIVCMTRKPPGWMTFGSISMSEQVCLHDQTVLICKADLHAQRCHAQNLKDSVCTKRRLRLFSHGSCCSRSGMLVC